MGNVQIEGLFFSVHYEVTNILPACFLTVTIVAYLVAITSCSPRMLFQFAFFQKRWLYVMPLILMDLSLMPHTDCRPLSFIFCKQVIGKDAVCERSFSISYSNAWPNYELRWNFLVIARITNKNEGAEKANGMCGLPLRNSGRGNYTTYACKKQAVREGKIFSDEASGSCPEQSLYRQWIQVYVVIIFKGGERL